MTEIRLITFDLDNTLWDVGEVLHHAEQQMRQWLDANVPEYTRTLDRDALTKIRTAVVTERPQLGHNVSALRQEVLFRGIVSCGYPATEARRYARSAFATFFQARQEVVFFEHALEALGELAASYQLGALTNGNADIQRVGLDRFFSFAFSSADVAASKPAPDIFHAALNHAGVAPQQCIHVGDNLIDDVHGAGSVGMHTIWVKLSDQPNTIGHTQPSEVVEDLAELPGAVSRIHTA